MWREPEDRYGDALEFRIALRKALPHLGMPSLPFANGGRSSRNISVPAEHTLLEDGLSASFEDVALAAKVNPVDELGGSHTRKMVVDVPEASESVAVSSTFGDSPMTETRPLKTRQERVSPPEHVDVSESEIVSSRRGEIAPYVVGIIAVLGGVAMGWTLLSSPQNESESQAGSPVEQGGRSLVTVPELEAANALDTANAVVVPVDLGVAREVPDAHVVVDLGAAPKKKASKKATKIIRRSKKRPVLENVVPKKKERRSTTPKASTPMDTLGKRCRTQFKEIVRDSDGAALVKSSPLCGRIGTLVKEAVKPKCGLTGKQRRDLNMLEVLCESNP